METGLEPPGFSHGEIQLELVLTANEPVAVLRQPPVAGSLPSAPTNHRLGFFGFEARPPCRRGLQSVPYPALAAAPF